MSGYDIFSMYYDSLTTNVDYAGRADYLIKLLERSGHCAGITLDLACGTGSLTLELYKRGLDVYGIDASPLMLSEARTKAMDAGADILYLCQKMQSLDLYGTVNTVFCSLDSINHLNSLSQIQEAFNKVSFFMDPGGLFVFDFNTIYKHENILSNNIYIYDMENIYCVWQNKLKKNHVVDVNLDFFEKKDKLYSRSHEYFSEITCSTDKIAEMLENAGFDNIEIFDDMTFDEPVPTSQRVVFKAKKKAKE